MADTIDANPQQEFARAFGDALNKFLEEKGIRKSDAARQLGLDEKTGKGRLNHYFHDSAKGTRPKPDAEILYLVCTKLPGFHFDYKGYRISAAVLKKSGVKRSQKPPEQQLTLHFDRQFNLTEQAGSVTVKV